MWIPIIQIILSIPIVYNIPNILSPHHDPVQISNTQKPGSVPGYFEQEAIACATSALKLSTLPLDQCQAYLALGNAQGALYYSRAGGRQAAMQLAWPDESDANVIGSAEKGSDMTEVTLLSVVWALSPEDALWHSAGCVSL